MNDLEKRDGIPSTSYLSKLGISAIGYTAGGVFLILLQVFSRLRGIGLVLGAGICVFGIASLLSKDPADRKAGALITVAGVLTILAKTGIPAITAISGTLLTIGAVGLLFLGAWNAIKFFIGLKKRS
jgi:hypothetical protein